MTVLADKDAIRELLHRYCMCMDEGRFEELGALFADDGTWSAPYRSATGPAAITAWLAQSVPAAPKRMHFVMNSIITPEAGQAQARSNYLVMVEGPDGPVASVCGTYDDRLVRTADGWRFQQRTLIHAFKGEMKLRLT